MHGLWVADVMTREVNTCLPDTSLHDVVRDLHNKQFSCLVVVEGNMPVGIITERDMVTILADMLEDVSWDALPVESFMSAPPITANEDMTLLDAVEMLRSEGIRHAPVVNRAGELIGVLTQSDIINGIHEQILNSQTKTS